MSRTWCCTPVPAPPTGASPSRTSTSTTRCSSTVSAPPRTPRWRWRTSARRRWWGGVSPCRAGRRTRGCWSWTAARRRVTTCSSRACMWRCCRSLGAPNPPDPTCPCEPAARAAHPCPHPLTGGAQMAELTVQVITRVDGGLEPTYAAADSGGDTVRDVRNLFLHVRNGDASPHTVTIVTPGTVGGLAIEDYTSTVPAGEERLIGPIGELFRASTGLASISYDGVTDVTVAAFRI